MFPRVRANRTRRVAITVGVLLAGAAAGVGAYFLVDSLQGEDNPPPAAPAPRVVIHGQQPQGGDRQPQAAEDLGFPALATSNTTRVAGADPVADAAGVALAVHPSAGGIEAPPAVTLVDAGDWRSAVAAASLVAPPVGAPILISGRDGVPSLTADALRSLDPAGSPATNGAQLFRIAAASAPSGMRTTAVPGSDPAAVAADVAALRSKLIGKDPSHILLVSADKPPLAMPAASWAARSGDAVLLMERNSAPRPTLAALRRFKGVPVFALGPASAISDGALKAVEKLSGPVKRVGAADPVQNAVDFARYASGSFGWDINDPGHGFVIAAAARPLDAAAAAPLSASGDWGPLLVTNDPTAVPSALRGYLLDLKPGYISDPTRAVYNHVWLLDAISVGFQAQVDDLAEVARVSSATGPSAPKAPPGPPKHSQAKPKRQ
jgi:hypothetical protein